MAERKFLTEESELIGENTLFLCHFDGDSVDSVSGKDLISGSWGSFQEDGAKFGKCAYSASGRPAYDISNLGIGNQYTIDFWYSVKQQPNNDYSCVFSTSTDENALIFRYWGSTYGCVLHAGNLWKHDNTGWISIDFGTTSTYPKHVAITRNGSTYKLFINGVLQKTMTSTRVLSMDTLAFGDIGYKGDNNEYSNKPWYGRVDEFRISNIVRWDSDFTVPDKPY